MITLRNLSSGKLSWMIWVGPMQSLQMKEGDMSSRTRETDGMMGDTGLMASWTTAKECWGPLEAKESKETDSYPETPEGMQPCCWHPNFRPLPPAL